MKKLFIAISVLLSIHAFSQDFKAEVGVGIGASNKAGLINWISGASYKTSHHLFLNLGIHLTSIASTPDMFGIKYGYLITSNYDNPHGLEPFVGVDYHVLSSVTSNDADRGWKGTYGAMWKTQHWLLQTGVSENAFDFQRRHKLYYITLGIYAIK